MANIIYNTIEIEPQEAMDKICDMFDTTNGETTSIVKTFYTEEDLKRPYNNGETEYPITDEGVLIAWLYDNVGTKWITGGVDDNIKLETANYLPDGFLIKLYQICTAEFDDVKVVCNWYDEYETNCGTAIVRDGVYTEDEEILAEDGLIDQDKIDWSQLSANPSAMRLLEKNQDKINWVQLSQNPAAIDLLKANANTACCSLISRSTRFLPLVRLYRPLFPGVFFGGGSNFSPTSQISKYLAST